MTSPVITAYLLEIVFDVLQLHLDHILLLICSLSLEAVVLLHEVGDLCNSDPGGS